MKYDLYAKIDNDGDGDGDGGDDDDESRRQDSSRVRNGRKVRTRVLQHNLEKWRWEEKRERQKGSARGVSLRRLAPSFSNPFFIFSLIIICSPVLPITTVHKAINSTSFPVSFLKQF